MDQSVGRRCHDHVTGRQRPLFRGWLHAAATPVFSAAGWLIAIAAQGVAAVATVIFTVAICLTMAISALYHLAAKTPRAQAYWRRADHSMISLSIAGVATTLHLLAGDHGSRTLLIVSWLSAITGVALKLTRRGFNVASLAFLVTGVCALTALPGLYRAGGSLVVVLVVAGGLTHLAGGLLFARKRLDFHPAFGYHESWHAITVVGFGLHLAAVAALVL